MVSRTLIQQKRILISKIMVPLYTVSILKSLIWGIIMNLKDSALAEIASVLEGLHLNYYIIMDNHDSLLNSQMHIYNESLKEILPALWYCLHLPRHGLDVIPVSPSVAAQGGVQHNILWSSFEPSEANKDLLDRYPPTLFISEDSCYEAACNLSEKYSTPLACVNISMLSSELLRQHWVDITKLIQNNTNVFEQVDVNPWIFSEDERVALPITFLTNQCGATNQVYMGVRSENFSFQARLFAALRTHTHVNTHAMFEEQNRHDYSEKEWNYEFDRIFRETKIPLVITLPGTPPSGRAYGVPKRKNNIEKTEKSIISFLGLQRATACNGVWLEGNPLPQEFFNQLYHLERHFHARHQNSKFIWNSMKRIGKGLGDHIGITKFPRVFSDTSHITAFTDFPIGLAIFPGMEDPLCCIMPISYRPLTPLNTAFSYGIAQVNDHYIGAGKGFKVMIIECLSVSDKIRSISDFAWKNVQSIFEDNELVDIEYQEISSIDNLESLLKNISDIDILVISAHGVYAEGESLAGLSVGDEVWIPNKEVKVPPIVILSACHVAAKGKGAYTVSDAFLNAGAYAVLGTLIPVDVRRNAVLTSRFFRHISEALEGKIKCSTLAEAWQLTVASNAIYEILDASERLRNWAYNKNAEGKSPLDEYFEDIEQEPLKYGKLYVGTINRLKRIARKTGDLNYLNSILESKGFFPESCFYIFSGYPEKVILNNQLYGQLAIDPVSIIEQRRQRIELGEKGSES